MNINKFFSSLLLSLIFTLSIIINIASATSYEQTAADISPGVFSDAEYYFPGRTNFGTTTATEESSSNTKAVYIYNNDKDIALSVYEDSSDATHENIAVQGFSIYGRGISGQSTNDIGVYGITTSSSSSDAGVEGYATNGAIGVYGYDARGTGIGVKAYSTNYGFYTSGSSTGLYIPDSISYGVRAYSDNIAGKFVGDNYGVYSTGTYYGGYFKGDVLGITAESTSTSSRECGLKGYNSASGKTAYVGCYNYGIYTPDNAKVDGNINVGGCSGCDVAEHFLENGVETLEPGDVVVLDATKVRGVTKTTTPYNKLAAGIISTDPTLVMGLEEGVPIALAGVVPTKVVGIVHLGDLLTTSSIPGYAMACIDMTKCVGAVIGKAMEENNAGKGKITALVMLG